MNHHKDSHHHEHARHEGPYWKRAHHDWKVWVGVTLMLVAIVVYMMTLNESVRPGAPPQPAVPAAP